MSRIELIAELRKLDEITLMELLQLTSDDLVDAFLDKITENQGKLLQFWIQVAKEEADEEEALREYKGFDDAPTL